MSLLKRILTTPYRLLHRFNYGDLSVYDSPEAGDMNRVAHRQLSPGELGRTVNQQENIAKNMPHTGGPWQR